MPTFDITEKCVAFMKETIKDMPGNPGQEALVEQLDYSGCEFTVDVEYVGFGSAADVDISSDWKINLRSNHPDAIEIIMKEAEEAGELIGGQAEIPGPWELEDAIATGNWKIVGWDSEWKLEL
jgi:hypothetical protein